MSTFFAPERYVTSELVLRSYFPGDGAKMSEAVNSSYDHLRTFMPWAKENQTVEESESLVRNFRASYLTSQDFVIGIFSPDESELWGGCGYHLREGPLETGNAEIGMWIRASQAGKGVGTAALKALTDWGFTEWNWLRLAWKCDVENIGSRRTAEKAGFTLEGTLRKQLFNPRANAKHDAHYFGMLKEEWERQRNG